MIMNDKFAALYSLTSPSMLSILFEELFSKENVYFEGENFLLGFVIQYRVYNNQR